MEMPKITEIIKIILTIMGGLYTLYSYRKLRSEKKIKSAFELFNNIYGDDDFKIILYYVDGGGEDGYIKHKGKYEQQADRTLKYINYIGISLMHNTITISDIDIYGYEIKKILNNTEVEIYIQSLKRNRINLNGLDYLKKQIL